MSHLSFDMATDLLHNALALSLLFLHLLQISKLKCLAFDPHKDTFCFPSFVYCN